MQKQVQSADPSVSQIDRVTVSLPPKVRTWANEMCEAKGYANFSAYVADLIRRDKGVGGPMQAA